MAGHPQRLDVQAARHALEELRQLERELVELRQVRRLDALERAREAVRRIGEIGSPAGILDRAAEELGANSEFDRVLISQVQDRALVPHALWLRDDRLGAAATLERMRHPPIALEYPLIEADVAHHQQAATVHVSADGSRVPSRLANELEWTSYVVVALTLRGATVGLLHADASPSDRTVDDVDQEVASVYADGLAGAFERAALRETLQRHRDELRSAVHWISGRLGGEHDDGDREAPELTVWRNADVDALTPREDQVLQLLIRGRTNGAIATALVISEGTVKYHVKNILRKLQATSRADAVARYLRGAP